MRARALLLLPLLLLSLPARADFFDDVSFALNKLGNGISETLNSGKKDPAPAAQPAPPTINWNPPPMDLGRAGTPEPYQRGRGQVMTFKKPEVVKDDMPAPKAAPPRGEVAVASIAPPPGFSEAATFTPPAPPKAPAPPVVPQKPQAQQPMQIIRGGLNAAAPSAGQAIPIKNGRFNIGFAGRTTPLSETLLTDLNPQPEGDAQQIILALKAAWQTAPTQRVRLDATAKNTDKEQARNAAFERALLIKRWLVKQGIPAAQVIVNVQGRGTQDMVSLNLDAPAP